MKDWSVDATVAKYEKMFLQYGDTAEGAFWKDENSRQIRYDQLTKIVKKESFSTLDFGCGSGSLIHRLKPLGLQSYVGVENVDRIRATATDKFPEYTFEKDLDGCKGQWDYAFVSGTFNYCPVSVDDVDWELWVKKTIQELRKRVTYGLAMNFMSTQTDWKDTELWYPRSYEQVLEWVSPMKTTILDQYGLYEWTLLAE